MRGKNPAEYTVRCLFATIEHLHGFFKNFGHERNNPFLQNQGLAEHLSMTTTEDLTFQTMIPLIIFHRK